jgi:hypothetical protein
MELKTAIEILDYHQEWRLGKRDDMIHEPKKLTEALDIVLSEVKKSIIPVVVGQSEQLVCSCGSIKVQTTGGLQCPNNRCSSAN